MSRPTRPYPALLMALLLAGLPARWELFIYGTRTVGHFLVGETARGCRRVAGAETIEVIARRRWWIIQFSMI